MRTIDASADALIAPCDGAIAASGTADGGVLVQAKGHTYTIDELVVDDERARTLVGGAYVTIYLSPRDYHRVHAPLAARLVGYDYVPGALWPVNPHVAARRDRLFARNERVVIWLDAPGIGLVAVVMIGASGVGNIDLVHGGESSRWRAAGERRRIELDARVERGDELGAFRLGSTVVVVLPPGALAAPLATELDRVVRFGERLGALA